jgi:hypothetical protein
MPSTAALQLHLDQQRAGGAGHALDGGVAFLRRRIRIESYASGNAGGGIPCGRRRRHGGCRRRRRCRGDVADHRIDHCEQPLLRRLRRIVVQRHRADLGNALHALHRRMLAQQDLEDVAALGLLHQGRRDEPDAAREAMDDAEMLHGLGAGNGTGLAMDLR